MLLRNRRPERAPEETPPAGVQGASTQDLYIVLKPTLHPELGEIRIDDDLFPIGRGEPPFAGYGRSLVAEMSRRHARIFTEHGAVYVADLESKNGTAVNGVRVRQKPQRLRHGDEVSFGGELAYRVELGLIARSARPAARLVSLTLTPERGDLGLQPIVVTRFPFLVSKADEAIARYRDAYPHQVNYVSRRHAHIFLKGGAPWVEDLGSTNGTFVGGKRLDEHAVALKDGDVLAFGGRHFVYRVSVQEEADSTLTRAVGVDEDGAQAEIDADKTTFIAAPDSFLDIFCVDAAPQAEDELNDEAADGGAGGAEAEPRRRSRRAVLLAELAGAFRSGERGAGRRLAGWGLAVAALLAMGGAALYLQGAPQRELEALIADHDYERAAMLAHQRLTRGEDDERLRTLATEALLKARVPAWLAALQAREFDRAAAALAEMRTLATPNPDTLALVDELAWVAELERFVAERGGVDATIRVLADEAPIRALVARWRSDVRSHQRALNRISTQVPAFADAYARALSLLRRLESDEAVYLAAIDRLKETLAEQAAKGDAAAMDAALQEYAERYPRLSGLDELRRRYVPAAAPVQGEGGTGEEGRQ